MTLKQKNCGSVADVAERVMGYAIAWSTQPSIPPGSVNRVPACLAGIKAGCVHLCRVAGNTV